MNQLKMPLMSDRMQVDLVILKQALEERRLISSKLSLNEKTS